MFIGILQNIFRSWAIIFSQSPKVAFLTNCAFALKMVLKTAAFWRFSKTCRNMSVTESTVKEVMWFQYGIINFDYSNFDIGSDFIFTSYEICLGKNVRQQLK